MSNKKRIFVPILCIVMCTYVAGLMIYAYNIVNNNHTNLRLVQVNLKYSEMLNVVVRVGYPSNTGSGVLIYRQHIKQDNAYVYYVITNKHVTSNRITTKLQVDGIRGTHQLISIDPGVVVRVFKNSATEWSEYDGEVVAKSPTSDLSLVRFQTHDYLSDIARLADSEMASGVEIFDEIYAVGCQLGDQVMPTKGIISGFLERNNILLVFHTAHTLPGSSGGGLFKKYNNHYYLIGLPQGIIWYRSHIMPHHGYAISIDMIYRFLCDNDMSFIYENGMLNEVQHAG